jgi:hypothetical protein
MVEIFFSILSRETLKGASFDILEVLLSSVESHVDKYNTNTWPFK